MSSTQRSELSASTARPTPAGLHQGSSQTYELEPVLGTEPWETAVELIRRSTDILLICHVSPDGDAIGSLLGLGLGLRILGKKTTLGCESAPPVKFSFLPGFESIVSTIDSPSFDLVIGLDSSDLSRLGSIYDPNRLVGVPLINVDHHVTNLYFGDIDLVDPTAASTAEIILTLLDHLGVSIDRASTLPSSPLVLPEGSNAPGRSGDRVRSIAANSENDEVQAQRIATCLLTGIVTDTLGFRTSNVTPQVMKAVTRLMDAGASLSEVTHHAFNQRPLVELSLLARGLKRMQAADGLAWSEITLADSQACGREGNGDAGLVGMLVRTKEVHMAAVFVEKEDNQVEIGFRADPGFDVARLALSLGGGGHPAASGCTIEGSLEAAKARVLPMLRAALEEQQKLSRSQTSDL